MDKQLTDNDNAINLADICEGDEVSFAHYYQPGCKSQFAYNIDWTAIKAEGNAMLLLSQKGLYCRPFDEKDSSTWSDSSIRAWLNGEFLKNSFAHGIEVMLLPTNSHHPIQMEIPVSYRLPEQIGFREKHSDQDYVFLLSEEELSLLSPWERQADAHWIEDKSQINNSHSVDWWLRPGLGNECKRVTADGLVASCACNKEDVFVRPAIWIDNFYIKGIIQDVAFRWKKMILEARKNRFDYDYFKRTASLTFDAICFYRHSVRIEGDNRNHLTDLFSWISQFSEINLQDESNQHRLAKNAAEAFYSQRTHWITIYKHMGKPRGLGALTHVLVMAGLNGESIVVDTKTFDLEHPIDKKKLSREGCFTI